MKAPGPQAIYLDNAATTHADPRVIEAMEPYLRECIGNPSSIHRQGSAASMGIEKARAIIAESIGAEPDEIVFTSGGTESNNTALKGVLTAGGFPPGAGGHVITSAVEHPSVLRVCERLGSQGFRTTILPVDREGLVDPAQVERAIEKDTILVSIIHGNNEIGTIEPIGEIGTICRTAGILFHTDACQTFTKTRLNVRDQMIDMVSLNAHKLHGPRGAGALFVRRGVSLEPLLHGGGQEGARRSGTENTPAIVGFGKAVEVASPDEALKIASLRDYLIDRIESSIPWARLIGPRERRLCGNACFAFAGFSGKEILLRLDRLGISVSTGSACSSGSLRGSHVLLALGFSEEEAHGAVRFSLGRFNTAQEVDRTVEALGGIMKDMSRSDSIESSR
jgi:cysteine desulfurase